MNRTIKFRYWNGYAKAMYPPEYFGLRLDGRFLVGITRQAQNSVLKEELFVQSEWHNKDILMQFTGLLDKNGKEIYEGDIVKTDFPVLKDEEKELIKEIYGKPTKIEKFYKNKLWEVCWPRRLSLIENRSVGGRLENLAKVNLEVIGNVWEHPELMSKE